MRFFDLTVRLSILSLFVFALPLIGFAQNSQVREDLSRTFKKFDLARIASADTECINNSSQKLSLVANGEKLELDVVPNDLRAPNYKAEDSGPMGSRSVAAPEVNTFKGTVVNKPGTEVRLTISGSKIEGFFTVGSERYFVEPASKYSKLATAADSVIYRAEDSLVDNSFACEADIPTRIGLGDKMVNLGEAVAPGILRRFDIATEADSEYVNVFGSAAAANSEILSVLNMVEGTYTAELNLKIRVTFQHTWSTADPYAGTNSSAILTNFQNYWNSNYPMAAYQRNTAHLFTAKSNSLSQGIAYLGVVCVSGGASYGLSGYLSWAPGKYLIPAHELGHNLGGQHVDATQSCTNTLMNASLTGATPMSFCSYSQNQINTYIATKGSCLLQIVQQPAAPKAKRFDFDGDNRADISVFRPDDGSWYISKSSGGTMRLQFGMRGDIPVSADYDGDGKADEAVFRNGVWWRLLSGSNAVDSINFGVAGDIPVPEKFDADAKTDLAVFRPSNGQWYWLKSTNSTFNTRSFGVSGDIPLPADFDGDGIADLNVFRPSNGTWYRVDSSTSGFRVIRWGTNGDKPLIGDFDGDSKSDVAVFRPATKEWFIIQSSDNVFRYYVFGAAGDVPAPGDYDGDGRSDVSVFRPGSGTWYRINSSNSGFLAIQYGLPGDMPVPSYYIQ
jgi:hypothetical protein